MKKEIHNSSRFVNLFFTIYPAAYDDLQINCKLEDLLLFLDASYPLFIENKKEYELFFKGEYLNCFFSFIKFNNKYHKIYNILLLDYSESLEESFSIFKKIQNNPFKELKQKNDFVELQKAMFLLDAVFVLLEKNKNNVEIVEKIYNNFNLLKNKFLNFLSSSEQNLFKVFIDSNETTQRLNFYLLKNNIKNTINSRDLII